MNIAEIEAAIVKLAPTEIDRLLAWLADYREKAWDQQIASDLESGKLDDLLAEVDAEIEAGIATPL
jgi:hypothetical protein